MLALRMYSSFGGPSCTSGIETLLTSPFVSPRKSYILPHVNYRSFSWTLHQMMFLSPRIYLGEGLCAFAYCHSFGNTKSIPIGETDDRAINLE